MGEKVTVVTLNKIFQVDRQKLAQNLQRSSWISKGTGVRPGQPVNLTRTPSDPISHERAETLLTIVDEYRKKS